MREAKDRQTEKEGDIGRIQEEMQRILSTH